MYFIYGITFACLKIGEHIIFLEPPDLSLKFLSKKLKSILIQNCMLNCVQFPNIDSVINKPVWEIESSLPSLGYKHMVKFNTNFLHYSPT